MDKKSTDPIIRTQQFCPGPNGESANQMCLQWINQQTGIRVHDKRALSDDLVEIEYTDSPRRTLEEVIGPALKRELDQGFWPQLRD